MKRTADIFLALAVFSQPASCQEVKEREYTITASVADSDGKPIQGAEITAGKVVRKPGGAPWQGEPVRIDGVFTDSNGTARIAFRSLPEPGGNFSASKDGYYLHAGTLAWEANPEKGGESRKAGISAVLKPVKNPIPMKVYHELRIRTPEFGTSYGFDLELGEALPPFGGGKVADIFIRLDGTRATAPDGKDVLDFTTTLECAGKDDGFVEFDIEDPVEFTKGSRLPSSHTAPQDGYVRVIQRKSATDAVGSFGPMFALENKQAPKSCYFRVRTKRDAAGRIVSAHYGKMYGPLEVRPTLRAYGHDPSKGQGGFQINYLYFNPKENDRNVEFDPKRNLVPGPEVRIP